MPPNDELGTLIGKTRRALVNRLNNDFFKAGFSITMEQWITLAKVDSNGRVCQRDLANILGLDKTSLTRMINGLEKRGWVERKKDIKDRRHKFIFLTDEGLIIKDKVMSIIQKVGKLSEQGIEAQDINVCKRVLQQIMENMNL